MPEIVRYLNKGPGLLQAYLFWSAGTFKYYRSYQSAGRGSVALKGEFPRHDIR
jgi:hypothetical protein